VTVVATRPLSRALPLWGRVGIAASFFVARDLCAAQRQKPSPVWGWIRRAQSRFVSLLGPHTSQHSSPSDVPDYFSGSISATPGSRSPGWIQRSGHKGCGHEIVKAVEALVHEAPVSKELFFHLERATRVA